jgi:hypothetical protein
MAPSYDGGSMWFILVIRFVDLCETGGANRGKRKIPDGKVESCLFLYSEVRMW